MTTIDKHGALHAGDGKYTNKPQSAAGYDLGTFVAAEGYYDDEQSDKVQNEPREYRNLTQIPAEARDAYWAAGYGGQMVGPFSAEDEVQDHIDTYLDDNSYQVVDGEQFDWDEAIEEAAEAARRQAEREAREQMRREDPEGYAQMVAAEQFERAKAHWTSANEARALAVIKRMDGVDDVVFDQVDGHCGHCGADVNGAHADGCRFDFGDVYNEHLFEGLYPHEAVAEMRAEHDRLADEANFYVGVRGMSGPSDPAGARRKALAVALGKVERSGWVDPREQGISKVRTGNGGSDYGKTGTLTYKGHEYRFGVHENLGTQSGTGYITVRGDDGRELGHGSYSVPKTDGGFARPDSSRLGDSIEEGALTGRLGKPLAQMFGGVDTPVLHVYGGKASLGIRDYQYGGAGLSYHGGRKWSGYGGPAYGDQAAQRRAAVLALGEGNEARGKKRLSELNALLTEVQAAHDAEFPPTAEQMKRRRR